MAASLPGQTPPTSSTIPTSTDLSRRNEVTPEPLDELEAQRIRERLRALGLIELVDGDETIASTIGDREKELATMVLQLTRPCLSSLPAQVVEQSRTISELVQQRDLILHRQQEQREFWEAERTSWARVVGALTTRRFADGTYRGDVLERDNITLLSENRILKSKLQDQQSRIDSLEGELQMLRPLLLLRPTSPVRGTTVLPGAQSPSKMRTSRAKDHPGFSDEEIDLHHSKRRHNPTKQSTTGDARAEHLLLATRKLGKERIARLLPASTIPSLPVTRAGGLGAGVPSLRPAFFNTLSNPYSVGIPPAAALPPNYTFPSLQALSSLSPSNASTLAPMIQTPTATALPGTAQTQTLPSAPSSPTKPSPRPSSAISQHGLSHPLPSPSKTRLKSMHSPPRERGLARPKTPSRQAAPSTPPKLAESTPSALDHLITASRILGESARRVESPSALNDGSPLQKRRKIDDGAIRHLNSRRSAAALEKPTTSQTSGIGRTMSALDVLAEQAAVVIAQSPRKESADVPSDEELNWNSDDPNDEDNPTSPTQPSRPKPSDKVVQPGSGKGEVKDAANKLSAGAAIVISRASSHAESSVGSGLRSPLAMRITSAPDEDLEIESLPPAVPDT